MKNLLMLLIAVFSLSVFAQDEVNFEQFKFDRLKRIRKELVTFQERMDVLKVKVEKEKDLVLRLKHESELLNLQRQYDKNRFQFIETATNVNLDFSSLDIEPEKRNLSQEIHDL